MDRPRPLMPCNGGVPSDPTGAPFQISRSGVRLIACPTASHHTAALCTDIAGRFPVNAFWVLFAQQVYYSTEWGKCQVVFEKIILKRDKRDSMKAKGAHDNPTDAVHSF